MAISSSLYSSISGLNSMGEAMSVLGDNVANLNTLSFKSSRTTFQDVLAQSVSTAAGSAQVGRGVTLSTVDSLFAQGSFESSTTATDMAIGGQGFFILRAPDTAEASLYTRAGEFRFDQGGNLVNPIGNFVQGWDIDSTTGNREGTIGDVNLGKSTPPVETNKIEVIVNIDADKAQEATETRLFNAWDGRNLSASTPTAAIDANDYEYTTAIKVYDSKGASHDITVYFDTTTQENVWEFLVTCDPATDKRNLTSEQQTVYAPSTTYDYESHKGSGALLYGVLKFSTNGDIEQMHTWDVPPDAEVDPAQNTNRKVLGTGDSYFNFATNFTGNYDAADANLGNQMINLSFGAKFTGQTSTQSQVLVSDAGALGDTTTGSYITKETLWANVADSSDNAIHNGDTFIFEGFNRSGVRVSLTYDIDTTNKVSDLLSKLNTAFNITSSIDSKGRLKFTDNTGGDSGLSVTRFSTISANGSRPFGGGTTIINGNVRTTGSFLNGASASATAVKVATTALTSTYDVNGVQVATGDKYVFTGTAVDGSAVNKTFTVGTDGTTIQNLMDWLSDLYADGATGATAAADSDVSVRLGADGTLSLIDNTKAENLAVTVNVVSNAVGSLSGFKDSSGNAVTSAATLLTAVYDASGNQVGAGNTFTFTGTEVDGTPLGAGPFTFTEGVTGTTVQHLLDYISDLYGDGAVAGPPAVADATVTVTLGVDGKIRVRDANAVPTNSQVVTVAHSGTAEIFGAETAGTTTFSTEDTAAEIFGAEATGASLTFIPKDYYEAAINVTTSKRQIVSGLRGETNASGNSPISATTLWSSVFGETDGGNAVTNNAILTFVGTKGDGTNISGTTANSTYTIDHTKTVQDLLDHLTNLFDADASIDRNGRLLLTDRTADSSTRTSQLEMTSISFSAGTNPFYSADYGFLTTEGDYSGEDGSQMGDTVSALFAKEALSTSQYSAPSTTVFQDQNGFASGFLQSVSADTDGVITGHYSNGQVLKKAQVALATFNSINGLKKEGGNVYTETTDSGAPVTGPPKTNGLGSIAPNSLEQSNVDLGTEFVKLITVQRAFQANSKIITTTDEMLNDLINIKR